MLIGQKQLRAYVTAEPTRCKLFDPGPHVRLTLEMQNGGQTPALNVRSVSGVMSGPEDMPPGIITCPTPDRSDQSRSTIATHGKKFINKDFFDIVEEYIASVDAIDERVYFFGLIAYEDYLGPHGRLSTVFMRGVAELETHSTPQEMPLVLSNSVASPLPISGMT